ncbi:hypothetical protein [Elioraea sp.]|uniref:hypothetical protein n=1 Tax=Elioraea sp. TaxID=2185103 RepID=UPI0021DC7662|nr:hypothetical protein [Elioraea sp.]GIX08626.1 MAG: hypothetical protein KatS3mg116_0336 [Elioraea sp.]
MTSDALLAGLWRHRLGVLAGALALWFAALGGVLLVPRAHVARAVVAPAETTGIAASSLLSPLPLVGGGLLDQRPAGNFAVYLGALRAREAAAVLRRETDLARRLAADRAEGAAARLLAALGLAELEVPDDDLMAWIARNTSATQSPASVVWVIEARHPDPALALAVLTSLHAAAEARVREEMQAMVARRLAFLTERAAREPDIAVRQSLYGLIAETHRHEAVLASDPAVAARIVSAPAVEDRPSVPNRMLLAALAAPAAALASLGIWTVVLIARQRERTGREPAPPLLALTGGRRRAD